MRSALLMSTSSTATERSGDSSLAARSAAQLLIEDVDESLHRARSERSVAKDRHRHPVQAEGGVDDVGGDLAEIQGPAGEVPERPLAPDRLVHRAQRFGREGGIRGVELDQEDAVAPVHDLGDALDRRLGERAGDLDIPRRGAVRRTRRDRRLESSTQGGGCSLVVARGKGEPGYRVEVRSPRPPRTLFSTPRVVAHDVIRLRDPRGQLLRRATKIVTAAGQPHRDADQEGHGQDFAARISQLAPLPAGTRRSRAPRAPRSAILGGPAQARGCAASSCSRSHRCRVLVPAPMCHRSDLGIGKVCSVQRRPPDGGAVISSLAVRPGGARRLVGHGAS